MAASRASRRVLKSSSTDTRSLNWTICTKSRAPRFRRSSRTDSRTVGSREAMDTDPSTRTANVIGLSGALNIWICCSTPSSKTWKSAGSSPDT